MPQNIPSEPKSHEIFTQLKQYKSEAVTFRTQEIKVSDFQTGFSDFSGVKVKLSLCF